MINYIESQKLGRSRLGWVDSYFHFDSEKITDINRRGFGVLKTLSDNLIFPGKGFDMHALNNLEIINYVVDGEFTHTTNMSSADKLKRGQINYMSATPDLLHSEYNTGKDVLRNIQILIEPEKELSFPMSTYHHLKCCKDRLNNWLHIATNSHSNNPDIPIKINQDVDIKATILSQGRKEKICLSSGRQGYLVIIEGIAKVNEHKMNMRDALEIIEDEIELEALSNDTHIILIEMSKGNHE